jgi:ketosteroid isomerase-like protein
MSQENVEIVHSAYEAIRERDFEALIPFVDPEVEIVSLLLEPEGPYRGHEGMRRFWADLFDVFPNWRPQPREIRDLGENVVLRLDVEGEGALSGFPVEQTVWQVVRFRDGRVTWTRFFRTEPDALEAVGLSEQDSHADS